MTESLKEFLESRGADTETITEATKLYVAELTGDKLPSEMEAEIQSAGVDRATLDAALADLGSNPAAVEAACLIVLSAGWDDERSRAMIRDAVGEAKGKAPVIELLILATVGMYGMYLVATGGRKKVTKTVERGADGKLYEKEVVEFEPPTETLKALVRAINPLKPST